jgi:lipopolysaccharide transport system permease protein
MISPHNEPDQLNAALSGLADQSTLVTRIRISHGWVALNLGEIWDYRELLYFLTWREVKGRLLAQTLRRNR